MAFSVLEGPRGKGVNFSADLIKLSGVIIMPAERSFLFLLALLLSGVGVSAQGQKTSADSLDPPVEPGVYCRGTNGVWLKLQRAAPTDTKTKGLDRFIYTDGLSGLNVTIAFGGAQSVVQIQDRRPAFYVGKTGSAKDALIVQLTRKKDSREAHASVNEAGVGNRVGFRRREIRRVLISPSSSDSFTATPEEDLKPGEYLLVLGQIDAAFDFGIAAKKN